MKTKRIVINTLAAMLAVIACTAPSMAKDTPLSEAAIEKAAKKQAKKEVKQLEKEDWKTAAGASPIEAQLTKTAKMAMMTDEGGEPRFIIASARSVGENQTAAKMAAQKQLRTQIASEISDMVTNLVRDMVARDEITAEQGKAMLARMVADKGAQAIKVGSVTTTLDIYRQVSYGNFEVQLTGGYPMESARRDARSIVEQLLGQLQQ